jgi:hypothetical protein
MKLYIGSLDGFGTPRLDDGETFAGKTTLYILKRMIDPPGFTMNTEKDPDRFMVRCLGQLDKFSGIKDQLPEGTLEERLDAFFKILVGHKLALWLE